MTGRVLAAACVAAAIAITGCSARDSVRPWSSDEARVNAAFPVAETVRNNQAWLLESATAERRKEVAGRMEARLKLRALKCMQGYKPSLFASAQDIRNKLGNTSCFTETDAELARWTGLLRAGVQLSRPPLKAPPASATSIMAEGFISSADFADQAGVALFNIGPGQRIQVVDMASSRALYDAPADSARAGTLAPNGRLFTVLAGDRVRILESETGAVILDVPRADFYLFQWLDARTAVVNRTTSSGDKTYLVDFVSGTEVVLPWVPGSLQRAVAAPGADNQYVIFTGTAITKVSLDRSGLEPTAALVLANRVSGTSWAFTTSDTTADKASFFGTNGRELQIVDLATLEMQAVSFEPFRVQYPTATPDPDKIIITGYALPNQGEARRFLLYTISRGTVALMDAAKYPSPRFLHIPMLKKQALIDDRRIEMLDGLALQQEVPLAQFVGEVVDLANQRKLAAFEKAQLPTGSVPAGASSPVEPIEVHQGDPRRVPKLQKRPHPQH